MKAPVAPAVAASAPKTRKAAWGMGLVNWVNPWYCMLILAAMYGYVWYTSRALHHLIGADATVDVDRIIDGDTFWGTTVPDGVHARFRLKQVDAPERDQPYGPEAGYRLTELLMKPNREIIVFIWEQDDWGRYIVDVVARDAIYTNLTYVNEEMVKSGMAWAFGGIKENVLRKGMEDAREQKIGLWADEAPVEPWKHRRQQREGRSKQGWFGGSGSGNNKKGNVRREMREEREKHPKSQQGGHQQRGGGQGRRF